MMRLTNRDQRLGLKLAIAASLVWQFPCLAGAAATPQGLDYYSLGCQYFAAKNFEAAIGAFDNEIEQKNADSQAFFKRGQCFFNLDDFKSALRDFDRVVRISPENADALLWRANAHARLGHDVQANQDYSRVQLMNPKLISKYCQQASINSAENEQVTSALASQPKEPLKIANKLYDSNTEVLKLTANSFSNTKNPQDVINRYSLAYKIDPKEAEFLYERAGAYLQLGHFQAALSDMSNALMKDPNNPKYYLARAYAYNRLGLHILAQDDIHSARFEDANLPKQIVFDRTREVSSARPDTKAKLYGSDAATLDLSISSFPIDVDAKDLVEQYSDAHRLNPREPDFLYHRAVAYLHAGRYLNAVEDLSNAIENDPNNSNYYLARALAFHMLGDNVHAKVDLENARFKDPTLPKRIAFKDQKVD